MKYRNLERRFLMATLPALFLLVGIFTLQARQENSFEKKADAALKQLYRKHDSARSGAEKNALIQTPGVEARANGFEVSVTVLLGDDGEKAAAQLQAAGFPLRSRIGKVGVLTVPVEELPRLAEIESVESLRAVKVTRPKSLGKPFALMPNLMPNLMPKMLRAANDAANAAVQAPAARSTYNLTGRGVVVGVIDSGIDWKHGDFRKADGKTRVKFLWDMSDPAKTGPGGLGRVYNETEINAALTSGGGVNEKDVNNHGTHVTGTAAGNGLSVNASVYAGIAPEADLVIVKGVRDDMSGFRDDDQIAGIQFIAERATALNEPFVINMSLGGLTSQHDGSEAAEIAIDELLKTGTGRQVVIAAGNEGGFKLHQGGFITQGVETTIRFIALAENPVPLLLAYSDKDDISIRVIRPDNTVVAPVALGKSVELSDMDIQHSQGNPGSNTRVFSVLLKQAKQADGWKLVIAPTKVANGRFDAYGNENLLGFPDGDQLQTSGSPASAKRAITVANYITKTQYIDSTGAMKSLTDEGKVGERANSSSQGPSRDGRIKPEIAAPGTYLFSSYSADSAEAATPDKLAPGGKHLSLNGTSMATPVTTGTVALMLQANRNLTADQIKRLLLRTASSDSFTGRSVGNQFGYGKLNALAAVKAVVDNIANAEFVSISAAGFSQELVAAPESIVAGFGSNLASSTVTATTTPLPMSLNGVSVRLRDSSGGEHLAPLFFASPTQINYAIPKVVAPGTAMTEVVRDGNVVARGSVNVGNVWPGLFTINGQGKGTGAAVVLRVKANGQQVYESVADPIDLSVAGERVILVLFGTGLRNAAAGQVKINLGGVALTPGYVGKQSDSLVGLDQVNVELPSLLAGRGQLDLLLSADGRQANPVQFTIK